MQNNLNQPAGSVLNPGAKPMMKEFPGNKKPAKGSIAMILASILIVLAGVATGYVLSGRNTKSESSSGEPQITGTKKSDKEAGIEDTSAFPDTAEGKLVEGGVDGSGTHHLERPGGTSQNVYLSSTVIDLESYVGKKVKVWGQTLSADRKAGWLMDVGRLQIVE